MAELIKAFASILWPLLVLFVVLTFRQTFHRILDSIERREIEIDVGGQRLTLRQLNDQQAKLITDLQRQVAALSKAQESARPGTPLPPPPTPWPGYGGLSPAPGGTPPPPEPPSAQSGPTPPADGSLPTETPPTVTPPTPPTEAPPTVPAAPGQLPVPVPGNGSVDHGYAATDDRHASQPLAVLWVDDHPEDNALLAEQVRDGGARVDVARTTNEALDRLSHRQYRLIISDMARQENGSYDPGAGVALLRDLRDVGIETPVVIYCSQQSRLRHGRAALEAGAVTVTDSSVQLFEQLQTFELL